MYLITCIRRAKAIPMLKHAAIIAVAKATLIIITVRLAVVVPIILDSSERKKRTTNDTAEPKNNFAIVFNFRAFVVSMFLS